MDKRIKYDLDHCYFISDTHFSDRGILKTFHRPFKDINEMNTSLYHNIVNTLADKNDTLFFLGDAGSGLHMFEYFAMDNIFNLVWILGNHDNCKAVYELFNKYPNIIIYNNPIMVNGLWLSHEPIGCMLPECPYLNIHGHTHSLNYGNGGKWLDGNRYFNVSVENIDYKPISFNEIAKRIEYTL